MNLSETINIWEICLKPSILWEICQKNNIVKTCISRRSIKIPFSVSSIVYTGWPQKNGAVNFVGLCSYQQFSFSPCWIEHLFLIIITPRSSNLDENFFILWVISYGLSFSGFAINLSLIVPRNSGNRANPENDSPSKITHKIKSSQPNLIILVLL